MKEIWEYIPGFNDYQVSTLGNIRSLKFNKEKLLKLGLAKDGYYQVVLMNKNSRNTKKVHQLVAITFLNHIPNGNETIVDHIDNNKLNNQLDNLQIINQRKNLSKDRIGYSSEYVGVSWHKLRGKWCSQIQINGKNKHLGLFDNELDAYNEYKKELILINK